jgi:predicted nucleic-acid-binding protein
VVFELVWTLKSFYQFERTKIKEAISSLFALEGLTVANRDLLLEALSLFVDFKIDFIDAYHHLLARKNHQEIFSFDEDFKKMSQ